MRIGIMGAGGMGGYIGARVGAANAAQVHMLARGQHLEALRRDGLTVRNVLGESS